MKLRKRLMVGSMAALFALAGVACDGAAEDPGADPGVDEPFEDDPLTS
jgi:hypothetical protein